MLHPQRVRFANLRPSNDRDFNPSAAGVARADQDRRQKRDVPDQSLIKMWLAEKVG
jgi:hypothetical protein